MDDFPCLPCRLRAADPEHQETMACVACCTLQPRRLLPTWSAGAGPEVDDDRSPPELGERHATIPRHPPPATWCGAEIAGGEHPDVEGRRRGWTPSRDRLVYRVTGSVCDHPVNHDREKRCRENRQRETGPHRGASSSPRRSIGGQRDHSSTERLVLRNVGSGRAGPRPTGSSRDPESVPGRTGDQQAVVEAPPIRRLRPRRSP
jgi:hypothetical protein